MISEPTIEAGEPVIDTKCRGEYATITVSFTSQAGKAKFMCPKTGATEDRDVNPPQVSDLVVGVSIGDWDQQASWGGFKPWGWVDPIGGVHKEVTEVTGSFETEKCDQPDPPPPPDPDPDPDPNPDPPPPPDPGDEDPPSTEEECAEPGFPNIGITELSHPNDAVVYLRFPKHTNVVNVGEGVPIVQRIVTINTPEERDLYGHMRLKAIGGNTACVQVRHEGQPYTLDTPFQVVNTGHEGCGIHTWHGHSEWFEFIPKQYGEVIFEAEVDPDPDVSGNGQPGQMATFRVIIPKVEKITATSAKADNSPQEFEGHKEWKFESNKNPNPGKHLVVFYKDIIDANLHVQNFDVDLEAEVFPSTLTDQDFQNEKWSQVSGPSGATFDKEDTFEVKFQNPTNGGIYKIQFTFGIGESESEANIVLPLAGTEIKNIVKADLADADAFAAIANAKYSKPARYARLPFWFWLWGRGDYVGRPDNHSSPTVWLYNEINDSTLMGGVATWFGRPIRIAKLSNFMYAYTMGKMGFTLAEIKSGGNFGTPDDAATDICYYLGWLISHGSDYDVQLQGSINNIWDGTPDEKHRKLWPNETEINDAGSILSPGFLSLSPNDI